MTPLTSTAIIDIPQKDKYHLFFYGGILHSFYTIDKDSLEIDTIIEYPSQFLPIDGITDPYDTSSYYIAGKQGMTNPENYLSFLKFNTNGLMFNIFIQMIRISFIHTNACRLH